MAALNASASMRPNIREAVRTLGERIRPVHGSHRPLETASVACEQEAAHYATAPGESCPAAVVGLRDVGHGPPCSRMRSSRVARRRVSALVSWPVMGAND
jgi:hypothetical protein